LGQGCSNGELLKAAEDAGFEVLLTSDKNMQHQQKSSKVQNRCGGSGKFALAVLRRHVQRVVSAVKLSHSGQLHRSGHTGTLPLKPFSSKNVSIDRHTPPAAARTPGSAGLCLKSRLPIAPLPLLRGSDHAGTGDRSGETGGAEASTDRRAPAPFHCAPRRSPPRRTGSERDSRPCRLPDHCRAASGVERHCQEQARASLPTMVEEMQSYYDDRSETWQESDKGTEVPGSHRRAGRGFRPN